MWNVENITSKSDIETYFEHQQTWIMVVRALSLEQTLPFADKFKIHQKNQITPFKSIGSVLISEKLCVSLIYFMVKFVN